MLGQLHHQQQVMLHLDQTLLPGLALLLLQCLHGCISGCTTAAANCTCVSWQLRTCRC
jgi:hypothetical protein